MNSVALEEDHSPQMKFSVTEIFNREYAHKNLLAQLEGRTIASPVPPPEKIDRPDDYVEVNGILGYSVHLEGSDAKGHIVNAKCEIEIGFPNGNKTSYFDVLVVQATKERKPLIGDIRQDGGKLVLNDKDEVVGIVIAARNTDAIIAPAWILK